MELLLGRHELVLLHSRLFTKKKNYFSGIYENLSDMYDNFGYRQVHRKIGTYKLLNFFKISHNLWKLSAIYGNFFFNEFP